MGRTMFLDPGQLPDVLPSERLLVSGKARPEVRSEFRRIANARNATSVGLLWGSVVVLLAVAVRFGPIGYSLSFVLMVPIFVRLAILGHEAAHKLLFTNGRVNDFVGNWVLSFPSFTPMALYRRVHFAHHREEFGPTEPDTAFYSGYPCEWSDLRRRLVRDAVGISGWKNLRPLLRSAVKSGPGRAVAWPILSVQLFLWTLSWLATGRWFVYPLLWLGPWMTGWRVANRLRALAEHGGLQASPDRRLTTHNVRQSWMARFWIVPYNTGWHLAHHVDIGVPWRNLPTFHHELESAGYITDAFTYPSYIALWRSLCSAGPSVRAMTPEP